MGLPSHMDGAKKIVFVGGGLGVAPIYPQARAAKESGAYVIGVLGFRTGDTFLTVYKSDYAGTNRANAVAWVFLSFGLPVARCE